jgi:hypothetical protein
MFIYIDSTNPNPPPHPLLHHAQLPPSSLPPPSPSTMLYRRRCASPLCPSPRFPPSAGEDASRRRRRIGSGRSPGPSATRRLRARMRRPAGRRYPPPSLSPIGCFRRRLCRAASSPAIASSTGQARAPFLAGIGNPEFPTLARRAGTSKRVDYAELPSARCRHRVRDQPRPWYMPPV